MQERRPIGIVERVDADRLGVEDIPEVGCPGFLGLAQLLQRPAASGKESETVAALSQVSKLPPQRARQTRTCEYVVEAIEHHQQSRVIVFELLEDVAKLFMHARVLDLDPVGQFGVDRLQRSLDRFGKPPLERGVRLARRRA